MSVVIWIDYIKDIILGAYNVICDNILSIISNFDIV